MGGGSNDSFLRIFLVPGLSGNLKVNALTLTVQNLVLSLANCLMTQKER